MKCCEDAIQIHGGYGYMVEYEMERELRDSFGSKLYSAHERDSEKHHRAPSQPVKILVPFKSVPDPYAGPGGAAKAVINSFDEIAIEEALRMRGRGAATEITGVTIGVAAVEEQIRSALAMGVDRAIRIDDARALDPYAVARIL